MSLGESIRSGVKWLAFGRIGNRFLEFAFGIALARLLVPADFGMIATIQIFTGFVGMFTAGGMGQSLIRAKTADDQDFNAVFTLQLAMGVFVYVGFYVAAPFIAAFFDEPLYTDLLRVSALSFLLRPLLVMRNAWLSRQMDFKSRTVVEVATGLLAGVVSVAMAWAGMGVWSLILSGLVASLVKAGWLARLAPLRPVLSFDTSVMKRHTAYGAKIVGNDLVTHLRTEAKTLIISKFGGPAMLGLFNKAESMARLPNQMLMAPTMEPLFRAMSKVLDNRDQQRYLFFRTITLVMAYTLPIYVMLWWVAEPFITVVYGSKWSAAGAPMATLAIGGAFLNIIFPCGTLLAAHNQLGREIKAQLINLVLVAAACAIGLQYGLQAVAWGIVASQALLALHLYTMVPAITGARPRDLVQALKPGLILTGVLSLVLGLLHLALGDWRTRLPALYLLLMGGTGVLTTAALFLFAPLPGLASESARWREQFARLLARAGIVVRLPAPAAAAAGDTGGGAERPEPTLTPTTRTTMSKKFLIGALTVVAAGAVALAWSARSDLKYLASQLGSDQSRWFTEVAPPLREDHHLFDLGVVDADGDGRLDVYTSNHNFRQQLLLALPQGGHRDVLTTWGLDQNRDFPAWEQSFAAPPTDRPGLYVYWLGDVLTLRTVGLKGLQPVSGTIRMFSKIEVKSSLGFTQRTETGTVPDSTVKQTTLHFSASDDGVLELVPPSRGVPTQIEIAGDFPLKHVHIGGQRANPAGRSFSPYLRDRHAMAWADLDGDGRLDLFISRGGVGGTLRMLPAAVRDGIRDELLLSGGQPPYADLSTARGIQKKDCSGRHARWVDFDGDGRLDLFVNCQNRGKAKGEFPKQLWQQGADGRFTDVAQAVGLGLTDGEIIDFAWIDVDGDGLVDLVTNEDRGFFVYRHRRDGAAHRFEAELVHRPEFVRADVEGLAAEVNNFWRFDGRLAVADADGDGDLDVFASSKHGNVLLVNDGGRLKPVPPADWGLPAKSLNATWVDTDNDGRPDLHTLPDGLYRQTAPGRFSATGLLSATPLMYQAAIVHWYDFDGDGRRDLFQALNENPALWRWWQKPTRTRDDEFLWRMAAWRNTAPARHWLQLDLVGGPGNRQAIGAQVTVTTPAGRQLQVVGLNDGAYFSQGHYRLYFGLGDQARVQRLSVRTGDGRSLELTDVAADRRLTIDLGAATAAR